VSALADWLLGLGGVTVLAVVGALVFLEDAVFVGFVVPGETAAVVGGVAASYGRVPLPAVIAVVVAAAIIGDSVGYEVGKQVGTRLVATRFLRKRSGRIDAASDLLARRGGSAVFFGRFIAFFRAVMPALAGTARMPYRRFLAFNAIGGLVWGVTFVVLGFLAGSSYEQVARSAGRGAAVAVLCIVLVALVIWRVRKQRAEAGSSTH
jgi:membrane-associated protein